MRQNKCFHKNLNWFKKNWLNSSISFIVFFLILNIYGKMEHKMLHNAPSLDLSSIILFWKKSRKIDHVSWIDTELIWNLIFPLCLVISIISFKLNVIRMVYLCALFSWLGSFIGIIIWNKFFLKIKTSNFYFLIKFFFIKI